jgi:hypothetical protein
MMILIITVPNNKLDIMICDSEKEQVAISADKNIIKQEAKRVLKYKYLTIPVITGASRTIKNSRTTYLKTTKSRNYRKQPYWALRK